MPILKSKYFTLLFINLKFSFKLRKSPVGTMSTSVSKFVSEILPRTQLEPILENEFA